MVCHGICAGLLALALSCSSAAAQGDFPAWNPRAKFEWALAHFSQYCPVSTHRRITFGELPAWMKASLVAATKEDVIQGIKDNCSQIQAVAAQY